MTPTINRTRALRAERLEGVAPAVIVNASHDPLVSAAESELGEKQRSTLDLVRRYADLLAANLSLGAELHKLKGEPTGIAAQTLVRWKKDLTRPHASAVKYLHEDLLNKFSKAFDRCHPAVAVQKHWHRPRGSKSSADDGALDAARFNPFEDEDGGTWPPDKSCPNPE